MNTFNGQIISLARKTNSVNGNPKYRVRVYKFDETVELNTATDAGFAYAITPSWEGKYATFKTNGRNQLTDITLD